MNKTLIKLPSDQTAYLKLQQFVENVCDYLNIQNTYFGNILVCLNEALTNAIKHGNKFDIQKEVTIEMSNQNNQVSFLISHEGEAFVNDDFLNNINPESTKGLFLIKTLSDHMEYQENGRTLCIHFNLLPVQDELKSIRKRVIQESKTSAAQDSKQKVSFKANV